MNPESTTTSTIRIALHFGIGFVLIAYGIARLTDTITARPPAAVYFTIGIGLLIYGISKTRGP